jgi:hypothetical protein
MNKGLVLKLLGILAIAIMVLSCTPKKGEQQMEIQMESGKTQTQIENVATEVKSQTTTKTVQYNYSKILKGDLSEFTGIWWVNSWGDRMQFMIDDETLKDGYSISNFSKKEDGSYYWAQRYYDERSKEGWAIGIYLYPAGVEIEADDIFPLYDTNITPSDTTKIRMGAGDGPPNDAKSVFYIETDYMEVDNTFKENISTAGG